MPLDGEAYWKLLGEGIVAFARRPFRRLMPLPLGLHRMPGPAVILGERFVDSPVGPFLSLAIGEPVRLGMRPGFYFGTSVLNSPQARRAGRQYWGFPHELGTLHWTSDAGIRGIEWEERGITVKAKVKGRPLPLLVPIRTMQRRSDGPVVVPTKVRSMARRSRVEVVFDDDDPLAALGGTHPGFALSGMLLRRKSARLPGGLFTTLRAPLRAPEPGVIGMKLDSVPEQEPLSGRVQWRSSGAYSSVG